MSGPIPKNPGERFWPKVVKTDGCWLWMGALSGGTGYGSFFLSYNQGRPRKVSAHRWSYEEAFGPIPQGMQIDHLCRNRACVNPAHLQAVSQRVNILRGTAPSAVVVRTNRCQRGHEFTPENTYRRPDGAGRQCRACIRIRTSRSAA